MVGITPGLLPGGIRVPSAAMRFYETPDSPDMTKWRAAFGDVVFACQECGSEQTIETDQLVPARTMNLVRCEQGHTTIGVPPARYRGPESRRFPWS